MDQSSVLVERFEENRAQLRAVAFRMLGSLSEADDAVQESWLRLNRSDRTEVENLGGWLKTVVARVCLDMLRARKSRREDSLDSRTSEVKAGGADPEEEALLADSVGTALLVVLETLAPAERVAFVLHDMFDVPFEEIGMVIGRSPMAARQLASRARRRVKGAEEPPEADLTLQRNIVAAFMAASRAGDFEGLLAVLDPDVVVRADRLAVSFGAAPEVRGAAEVAGTFLGRAQAARPALVDGVAGLAWVVDGRPRVVFELTFVNGRIATIDLLADNEVHQAMDLVVE
ncbi:sigma-70 family RNA polymerase sigma factor [Fimbriimonas ginsengisoli]|uniref:RNA polymerase, sigma-24 subunit, ECF subfamily n=1 Tax=Fimbriimonas ginsengisoli Gsoil 348 TaxID=661478 RepID=A0A068NJT3_FIMGI|nr:sigma-70 family RNA polymerase sigma factor [Fimbriimonas ginsengisoli]AIE83712.1 RNA polymerase, sigma-24 subunit, ECF subfamily [Fimbriimonas ginsengisoli Gsoil 348]